MNIRESSYGYWSSNASFLWVAGGAVIGIGNIARLPYLMGEHGGIIFLFVYLLALVLVGLPLLLTEWLIGRWMRDDVVSGFARITSAAKANPAWASLGWISFAGAVLILSYYSVIAGWSAAYAFRAAMGLIHAIDAERARHVFAALAQDAERGLSWHTLFMVMATIVVSHGIRDGMERASRVWVPIAFLMAITICVYAAINGNSSAALIYLLTPDFGRCGWRGVLEALHLAFFTLGLGMGVMLTLGTYLPANAPLVRLAVGVVLMDTVFSLVAGFAVFALIFDAGLDPQPGIAILFKVFPQALPNSGWGMLMAVLFFAMLFIITLSAGTTLLETATRFVMERQRTTRAFASTTGSILIWFVGLWSLLSFSVLSPMRFYGWTFFEWAQWLSTSLLAPLAGLMICVFAGRFLPPELARGVWGERYAAGFRIWSWLLRYPARIGLIAVLLYSMGVLDWLAQLWSP
ncbi:MAG TPA: sodium-dependent transporter [Nevskiaceae bacterium]|nr:sodium-dependent transporter [Nevskiaceae bacterium]